MINDFDAPGDLWKYVDDTTISELVGKGQESNIQPVVDTIACQSTCEGFQLNESKCKELRISFAKDKPDFEPIVVNGKSLETVLRDSV